MISLSPILRLKTMRAPEMMQRRIWIVMFMPLLDLSLKGVKMHMRTKAMNSMATKATVWTQP